MPSLYFVNPASDFSTYCSAEMFGVSGLAPAAFMGDLPSTTVAAFAPADFQVSIRDGNISPIDFDADADWVAITGKVNQRRRMTVAADE